MVCSETRYDPPTVTPFAHFVWFAASLIILSSKGVERSQGLSDRCRNELVWHSILISDLAMQAAVDVDKLWAALQQSALGSPKIRSSQGSHGQPTSLTHTSTVEPIGAPLSNLRQPALRIETAQQKLQSADSSEKLASLKAIKVVNCIGNGSCNQKRPMSSSPAPCRPILTSSKKSTIRI